MSRHAAEAENVSKLDTVSEAKPTEENFDAFSKERTLGREDRNNSQISESASVKPEFKMDPQMRESAMSVIRRAYGDGGLDGPKGADPEIAPEKHLKELKEILEPKQNKYLKMLCESTGLLCSAEIDLARSLNTAIKEDKMSQYRDVAKEVTGKADIDSMFNIYGEATSARRGIPTADGDPAGDGYQWGKQETMKKFPEQFKGENGLTAEAKKYWMETGLAYEAGRYTDGLVNYLGRSNMNEAEQAVANLGTDGEQFKKDEKGNIVSPLTFTDEVKNDLLRSFGDVKDQASFDSKLKATIHSQLLKSALLAENATAEKALGAVGSIYGMDEKESVDNEIKRISNATGKQLTAAKDAWEELVNFKAEQIKQALGPLDFSKK